MPSAPEEQLWIGLVHVTAIREDVFPPGTIGGYTNALAMAVDRKQFVSVVTAELRDEGYAADKFDDVELYEVRISKSSTTPELRTLAERAELAGTVELGTFHIYSSID